LKNKNTDIKKRTLYQKIVNIFIGIFIAFLFLVFLFFGISQTSTFRDYLRGVVVENVNNSINGNFSLRKIEGTLLTSLYLRGVVITSKKDTLLKAETIELKTSPLQLLFKKLLIRKIELKNSGVEIITYKNGGTNLDYVFASEDTTNESAPKPFPFFITISNAVLNNVQFYLHDETFNGPDAVYDSLTTQNLFVKNINASFSANVDLNKKYYDVIINSFSFKPNIKGLTVQDINSHLTLNNSSLIIDKLNIRTSNSDIIINGSMKKENLLKAFNSGNIGNAAVKLNLISEPVDLNEIGKFVPSIQPIKGTASVELHSSGKFNNFDVEKLKIILGKSQLNIGGQIKNLDNTDNLNIIAFIKNSTLLPNEISDELQFLNLPEFKEMNEVTIDTLSFRGKKIGFISGFKIAGEGGKILGNIQMNFLRKESTYFAEINTRNIHLSPLLDIPLTLNSKINIFGVGTDLRSMNTTVNINAANSVYNNKTFDVLNISSKINNGKIGYQINTAADTTIINARGNVFVNKDDDIQFDIKAELANLNIFDFSNDSSTVTNINLVLVGNGIKNKDGEFNLSSNIKLKNSYLNDTPLYGSDFKINISGNNRYIKKLNLASKQIDAELKGRFSFDNTAKIISDEINSITDVVNKEVDKLTFVQDTILTVSENDINNNSKKLFDNDSLVFSFKFKQFNLQSPFAGSDNININGVLNGSLSNKADTVNITFSSKLDYVKIWGDAGVYFLSNLSLNVDLNNVFGFKKLSNLQANIDLKTKRIFAGSDIKNIKLNYNLKSGKGILNFNSDIEDKLKINLTGKTEFGDYSSNLIFNKLRLTFKKYLVKNEGNINISYSNGRIDFKNFVLTHNKGKLKISGALNRKKGHNLFVTVSGINLADITNNILDNNEFKNIYGVIGLNASLKGSDLLPVIDMNLKVNNVIINNHKIGQLKTRANYINKKLSVKLFLTDSSKTNQKYLLSVAGSLPIDLNLNNMDNRLLKEANANIKLNADSFNLYAISNFIPEFTNLNGILYADLDFKGRLNNLLPTGIVSVKKISFISDYNNMKYNAELKFSADKGVINLDSLFISNAAGTKNGGTLTGFGKTILKNYEFTSPKVFLNGQLKILNKASKAVSPFVYGDLVVATQGRAEFMIEGNKEYLKAPLLVKRADITFPQAKPSFKNTRSNFIYKYVSDTANVDQDISSFDNLIKLSRQRDSSKKSVSRTTENLVFDVDIKVEDEASITFILDKEFNQILNANISGNFQYKTVEETPRAFGTLTLREGSTLEFLTKTFEAGGTLRFENELTNPFLDVVGIYRNYYYEPTVDSTNTTSQEKEVAVKVKLRGPLHDLNKNFVKTKDNLAVYYGTENIDKDIPDVTKDASDAIMFIVTGHFSVSEEGFTNTGKANTLTGTASSIAGSLIGGLLNSYAGDYIRSVELKQVGSYTKFSLSGKVNKFKYTIGGTTEVFQDLSRTNIRIEYPFFQKFFIRVERKESLTESSLLREMINELGLKYKFEF